MEPKGARCNVCRKDLTRAEFDALVFIGNQPFENDEGKPSMLVMRNCKCGSTITIEVTPDAV